VHSTQWSGHFLVTRIPVISVPLAIATTAR
jgi:hypothetical protein